MTMTMLTTLTGIMVMVVMVVMVVEAFHQTVISRSKPPTDKSPIKRTHSPLRTYSRMGRLDCGRP
jgi:hypothetical protein